MNDSISEVPQRTSGISGYVTILCPKREGVVRDESGHILDGETVHYFMRPDWRRLFAHSDRVHIDWEKLNLIVESWRLRIHTFIRSHSKTVGVEFHNYALLSIVIEQPGRREQNDFTIVGH